MTTPSLSLVLPCFNEEENIPVTTRAVLAWMHKTGKHGEVIIVNDGSKDRSAEVIAKLMQEDPMVKTVNHEKNLGYGLAVRSGLDAATCEYIGFMDSDGQFRPEDFDLLLPKLSEFAFAAGRRKNRADSFVRNMFGKILGGLNLIIFGIYIRDVNCGMKVFRKNIWQKIRPVHGVEKLFCTELFLRLKRNGIPWVTVPVHHYPRTLGTPTGAKMSVIVRMFKEIWALRRNIEKET